MPVAFKMFLALFTSEALVSVIWYVILPSDPIYDDMNNTVLLGLDN